MTVTGRTDRRQDPLIEMLRSTEKGVHYRIAQFIARMAAPSLGAGGWRSFALFPLLRTLAILTQSDAQLSRVIEKVSPKGTAAPKGHQMARNEMNVLRSIIYIYEHLCTFMNSENENNL